MKLFGNHNSLLLESQTGNLYYLQSVRSSSILFDKLASNIECRNSVEK